MRRPAISAVSSAEKDSDDDDDDSMIPTIPAGPLTDSGVVSDRHGTDQDEIDENSIVELPHSRRVIYGPVDDETAGLPEHEIIGLPGLVDARIPLDDDVIGLPRDEVVSHNAIVPPPPDEKWAEQDVDDDPDLEEAIIFPHRD